MGSPSWLEEPLCIHDQILPRSHAWPPALLRAENPTLPSRLHCLANSVHARGQMCSGNTLFGCFRFVEKWGRSVGPRRVEPRRVGPRRLSCEASAAPKPTRRVGGPKFHAFLSLSHHIYLSIFPLLGVFSLNLGGVFEGGDPEKCKFRLLGCRVKPRRLWGRQGFARQPQNSFGSDGRLWPILGPPVWPANLGQSNLGQSILANPF